MASASLASEATIRLQGRANTKILEAEFKSLQETFCVICERAVSSMQALEKEVSALRAEGKNPHQRPRVASVQLRASASVPELPGEIHKETPSNDIHEELLPIDAARGSCASAALQVPDLSVRTALSPKNHLSTSTVEKASMCKAGKVSASTGTHFTASWRLPFGHHRGDARPKIGSGRAHGSQLAGGRHRAVFADVDHLKARMRMQMAQKVYDVHDFYKTSGYCQQLARSSLFENLTFFLIAVNAVWIGIESDHNPEVVLSESPVVFQIAAHSFCTYFLVEWLIRFFSFARKSQSLTDVWFAFDTLLVILTVAETWCITFFFAVIGRSSGEDASMKQTGSLRLLRLLRLTRMGRILHLLRAIPEIMMVIKGMVVAIRSVSFTLILLIIIIYVFAISLAQLTKGLTVGDAYFSTVPHSMESLLMQGTFLENIPDLWDACVTESVLSAVILLVYILIATVTLMNTLIGVLCKVISVVAEVEKESLMMNYTKEFLEEMWADCNVFVDEDTMLSNREFDMLIQHPLFAKYMNSVEVDVISLIDFTTNIFRDPFAKVSFPDFMELILNLRGTNNARVKDIMDLRKFMFIELEDKAEARHQIIKSKVNVLETVLYRMAAKLQLDLKKSLKHAADADCVGRVGDIGSSKTGIVSIS